MYTPEEIPIHVKDLQVGAQLRISMKAGRQISQDHTGFAQSGVKSRRSRAYARHTFFAYLVSNDPVTGTMSVDVQGYRTQEPSFPAQIKYADISILQRVISSGRPVTDNARKGRPGSVALGTSYAQLFQQPYLIKVLF